LQNFDNYYIYLSVERINQELLDQSINKQLMRLLEADEDSDSSWIFKLGALDINNDVLVTDLGWQGEYRDTLDEHLKSYELDLNHTREVRSVLEKIAYPMIDGNFPLDGELLLVGTLKNLDKKVLINYGLNLKGVQILRQLFPNDNVTVNSD
jgi:hypothetical protein